MNVKTSPLTACSLFYLRDSELFWPVYLKYTVDYQQRVCVCVCVCACARVVKAPLLRLLCLLMKAKRIDLAHLHVECWMWHNRREDTTVFPLKAEFHTLSHQIYMSVTDKCVTTTTKTLELAPCTRATVRVTSKTIWTDASWLFFFPHRLGPFWSVFS